MPRAFKDLYPTTRVIIDCTELYVQTPSSLLLQSQLYSSYKSNTTLKGLMGMAPHGAVTFVSSLKGFDIEDIFHKKKIKLNITLQSKGQFSVTEAKNTKSIAKLCIHVER